jgi:recombination protein RecR
MSVAPLAPMIEALAKLPGIGPKTAERLAFFIVKQPMAFADTLGEAIVQVRQRVQFCGQCHVLSEGPMCPICTNTRRNQHTICVVADSPDLFAIERTQAFDGRYHVLGGLISPLDGVGPQDLHVRSLIGRCGEATPEGAPQITEAILALPPTTEGDTTSLYLARLMQPLGVKVTRIAFGLPVGGNLDYADQLTLTRAMTGRSAVV